MRLVLFEPDIPQNTGTILRLAACFNVEVDLIEPFGFIFDERRMRRAGMDYLDHVKICKHKSWQAYKDSEPTGRLILATTRGAKRLDAMKFQADDRLMFGRESQGVPEDVHNTADAGVLIPMQESMRSINVALSAGIILAEGLRQTEGFPA
ncbi:MAG: tRNA (cytidine(34)-2'-O)-methyltransferase [Alphaproteobacteria bacterium]